MRRNFNCVPPLTLRCAFLRAIGLALRAWKRRALWSSGVRIRGRYHNRTAITNRFGIRRARKTLRESPAMKPQVVLCWWECFAEAPLGSNLLACRRGAELAAFIIHREPLSPHDNSHQIEHERGNQRAMPGRERESKREQKEISNASQHWDTTNKYTLIRNYTERHSEVSFKTFSNREVPKTLTQNGQKRMTEVNSSAPVPCAAQGEWFPSKTPAILSIESSAERNGLCAQLGECKKKSKGLSGIHWVFSLTQDLASLISLQ